jgi:hypothetical protein
MWQAKRVCGRQLQPPADVSSNALNLKIPGLVCCLGRCQRANLNHMRLAIQLHPVLLPGFDTVLATIPMRHLCGLTRVCWRASSRPSWLLSKPCADSAASAAAFNFFTLKPRSTAQHSTTYDFRSVLMGVLIIVKERVCVGPFYAAARKPRSTAQHTTT